jgi:uncharacterized protein
MTAPTAAEQFLRLRRIALVGVSRKQGSFGRALLRAFLERGYDAVPVNRAGGEIEGRPAFASVAEITPPVEGAVLIVLPAEADSAAADALAAGVRQLWFHRGAGPGSSSPQALARCAAAGVVPVTGLCPLMVLPGAGWFHRLHSHFRRRSLARAG